MGSSVEGNSIMEMRKKQPANMVCLHIHIQYSRNTAYIIYTAIPEKEEIRLSVWVWRIRNTNLLAGLINVYT